MSLASRRRYCPTLLRNFGGLLLMADLIVAGGAARAQSSSTPPQNTDVNLNYVYAATLGFGGYSIGGLNASVYTLPLSTSFDNVFQKGWTLRLLLPIQLGLYHFKDTYEGQTINLNQQSIAAIPGAELDIPVTSNFVVKPFAQGGVLHLFGAGDDVNANAWVYLTGARSVAQWRAGAYTFSLGNGVILAGDTSIGPATGAGGKENYVALEVGGEIRRALGFTIGNWTPDLGIFAADFYYPEPMTFTRFLQSDLKVHNQNEVGFSIGSAEPMKLLWMSDPRIGFGYIFGDGLSVWTLNFGFPF